MSLATPGSAEWIAGLMAGCERLVHASLTDPIERARRARFVAVAITAPFFGLASFAFASYGRIDAAVVAASFCLLCGVCWLAALLVVVNVRRQLVEGAALAVAVAFAPVTLAASGGPASPLCALVAALLFESWWVGRSREALFVGFVATLAVLGLQFPAAHLLAPETPAVSAWQWLVPLAYALTVWMRLRSLFEAALAAKAEDAEVPLEARIDAVVARIADNGEVVEVSAQALRLFHLAPELLLGASLFERVHVADRVAYLCALSDARENAGRSRADIRLRVPREEGRTADYRPFAVEMIRASESREVIVLIRENDEVASLRTEIANVAEQASSSEVAKNRFLAAVSHELRTPLNAILGFSDMLVHEMFGPFADARQKEYVGLIHESGNHLLSVVNSILDVSKIESGAYAIHPEPFAFADAVEMCRSMMAHQASMKSISLRVALPPDAGEICADRRAVQQILINLVSNAIKFTPEGGSVVIGAKRMGARFQFWVSDTGIGISQDDLQRLGQPFTQVQNDYTRQFEGAGLGLSLVKGLVVLHDGTMTIESAPGEGTIVTVAMPLAGERPDRTAVIDEVRAAKVEISSEAGNGTQRKTA